MNALACGDCRHLGAPIPTQARRPIAQCLRWMVWRFLAEVVPACKTAERKPDA